MLSLEVQPTTNQGSLPNNLTQSVLSLPELLTGKGVAQATGLTVNPNGEVVLTGDGGAGGDIAIATPNEVGINSIDANGLPGTGNISIRGSEIGFLGAGSAQGKGTFSIEPFSPNVGIRFQDGLADDPQAIDLGTPFLSSLRNGFSAIVFGGKTTTGNITVENLPLSLSFQDPVSFNTQGSILVNPNQSILGTDNASIALTANKNITLGNITKSGSGDITLTSTAGTIALNDKITTIDQNITFSGPVILQNNVSVDTGALGGDNILFSNTVNGTTANNQNLTLTAGTGNITFKGDVGNPTIAIGNLNINSATEVTTAAITANSINLTATGKTTINGLLTTNGVGGINLNVTDFTLNNPVTTLNDGSFTINNTGEFTIATGANLGLDGAFIQGGTGKVNIASSVTTTKDNITFKSPVTLKNDVSLNTGTGNGNITFNKTVDGINVNSQNLTLAAGTGNITLKGDVGSQIAIGNLQINSATDVTAAAITANSIT